MPKEKAIISLLSDYIGKKARAKFKSNVEFANMCDISEATIRRILQGKQNISVEILKRVCDALEVKMSDILKEIGE